jgi:hypothetical protein
MCIFVNCICLAYIVVILCVFIVSYMYLLYFICICLPYMYLLYYVCIAAFTLDAGVLARSQYPEGPATGHLNTDFSWFSCVYKQMLRWFQVSKLLLHASHVAPPNLNFLVTLFPVFVYM